MQEINFFISFVEVHRYTGYAILFLAMIFEGELFLLSAGILANLGAFDLFDVFFFAFSGVIVGDLIWYFLGRFFKDRYPEQKIIKFVERRVRKMFPTIDRNPFKLVFASKFLYGFNHSTIFILGFLKTEFWHFLRVQAKTSFLWVVIFLTLGYFFGFTAVHITKKINKLVLALLIILIGVLVVERIIDYIVAKRVAMRNNKREK